LPPHADATEARGEGGDVISFLEGVIAEKHGGRIVISVGGVGYDVQVPASAAGTLPPVGKNARVQTRMVVRDDAMILYGFASIAERAVFALLVTVTGVASTAARTFC